MKIFIDESGNFTAGTGQSRTCCVAALIVPDTQVAELLAEFVALRISWTSVPEVKSTALTDEQRATVLRMLTRYDVVVLITAFDKLNHPTEQLDDFQHAQGEAFVNGLTPSHNQNARRFANELRTAWLALSPQLMAQLQILIVTIEDIIRLVPNYYAQHRPEELGRWDWIIDPKDIQRTPYERLWERVVCPVLQTSSVESAFMRIAELDWSAFERFHRDIPDYVHPSVKRSRATGDGKAIDLNLLMRESIAFPDSRDEPGLQLVDIVAGTFTKAMNGTLAAPVWRLLGPMMLQRPAKEPVARLAVLGAGPTIRALPYHEYVLNALTNRCKNMFRTEEPPRLKGTGGN